MVAVPQQVGHSNSQLFLAGCNPSTIALRTTRTRLHTQITRFTSITMVMEAPRVQHSRPAGYHPMVQQAPEVYPVVKLDSASKRSGRTSEAGSRPMSEISSNYSVPPPPKNFVRQVRCRSESPEPKRLSDYLDSSAFAKSRQYKGGPVYDPSGVCDNMCIPCVFCMHAQAPANDTVS